MSLQPFRPVSFIAPASLALGVLLSGCQKPPAPVADAPAPLPYHLGLSPAAVCTVAPFHVADGGTAVVSMTVANDGGYCAATLTNNAGLPFDAPLLPARPPHGERTTVVKYNGKTSIEYTPNAGYSGPDSFTVHLINRGQSGFTTLQVNVTVQPGASRTS